MERPITVVAVTQVQYTFCDLHAALCPCEVDGGWVEVIGQTEESVHHTVLSLIPGVDGDVWSIWSIKRKEKSGTGYFLRV